jgi:hypothetical protein
VGSDITPATRRHYAFDMLFVSDFRIPGLNQSEHARILLVVEYADIDTARHAWKISLYATHYFGERL